MKTIKLFILLFVSTYSFSQNNDKNNKYYRHLRNNHFSPYIELAGIYPIDKTTADNTSHYIFKYDKNDRLIEITNNHYHTERRHPLASLGVYKLKIAYDKNKATRTFYDKNGKRIKNDRAIYKEVYEFKKGFNFKMSFYDLDDKPMESNWNISEYKWSKKRKLIIERRFNLKNEPVALSPYFKFGITGIELNKKGQPKAHYNLNDKLKIVANEVGVASYQDTFDENENHVKYTYHDVNGDLVMNQWGFAIGQKVYNNIGNQTELLQFDTNNKRIRGRKIPLNTEIELASKAKKTDSLEIKKISLGYLIALQDLKPQLMDEVMNDSLKKVTIGYDRKSRKEVARATTRKQMIDYAKNWNKSNTKFPFKPINKIKILDIYNRIATVKLVSDNWVEYLHLIKLNKKWSIVNLIWQYKDIKMYPKE